MTARTFPVPVSHRRGVLAATATLDDIDLAATLGDAWARHVLNKENTRILASILGEDRRLPVGVMDGDMIVGLWRDGESWRGGWTAAAAPPDTELLDADTVAFVARSLVEDRPVVALPYTPFALLSATSPSNPDIPGPANPAKQPELPKDTAHDLPANAKVLAVVDDYDRNAVMDLVVVLPGPKVMRRHAGEWRDDPTWVNVLRSVRPPPVVQLAPEQVQGVLDQIDEATKDLPFDETDKEEAGKEKSLKASAWQERADEMAILWALTAAPVGKALSQATPGGRMPANLRQYWAFGRGAAKIRWGTPGAWRRCYRNLVKYVGPTRAPGTCTNLAKLRGGHGVATHVGD
ncbi:MAG TPA: hypothetical protein VIQ02_17990 [Jiangellaceae bacterium]